MVKLLREVIREIFDKYPDGSPYDKIMMVIQMRTFFSERSIDECKDAIDMCQNDMEYRILMGVGLKGQLWYYLAKRRGEMLGV
jgi:hypothetical protein